MRLLGLTLFFALCASAQAQIFVPPFFNRLQGDVVTTNTTNAAEATATTHNTTISTGSGGVIVAAISARMGSAGQTVSSVTICGTTATQQVQQNDAAAGTTVRAEIWSASGVTSSASCTLTTVCSASCTYGLSVYQLANVSSHIPTNTKKNTGSASISVSPTYLAGSSVIAVVTTERGAGAATNTWSGTAGIVEDTDATIDAGNGAQASAAHKDEASAATATVISTFSATVNAGSMAAAAFR